MNQAQLAFKTEDVIHFLRSMLLTFHVCDLHGIYKYTQVRRGFSGVVLARLSARRPPTSPQPDHHPLGPAPPTTRLDSLLPEALQAIEMAGSKRRQAHRDPPRTTGTRVTPRTPQTPRKCSSTHSLAETPPRNPHTLVELYTKKILDNRLTGVDAKILLFVTCSQDIYPLDVLMCKHLEWYSTCCR